MPEERMSRENVNIWIILNIDYISHFDLWGKTKWQRAKISDRIN